MRLLPRLAQCVRFRTAKTPPNPSPIAVVLASPQWHVAVTDRPGLDPTWPRSRCESSLQLPGQMANPSLCSCDVHKNIHKVPSQFSKQRLSLYFMSPNYSWNQLHWISWTHVNTFLFAASPMIPMLLESPKQDPLPSGNSATKRPSWPLQSCHWPLQNATRSPRLPQAVHRDTASAFLRRLHVAPAGTAATKWIEMMDPEFGFEVWLKTKTGEWRSKVMTEGIKHNFLPPHCNIHPSTFTPPADLRGGSSSMLSSQHLFDTAKDVSKACYKNPLHTQEAKGRGILQGPFISTHRRAW